MPRLPEVIRPQVRPEARPVVIRFPALGDTVVLTTLIRALAMRYGTQVDILASGPWVPEVLAHNPHIGELRLIRSRRAPYWLTPSQWTAVHWLKGRVRAGAPIYFCERDEFGARLLARAVTDPTCYVRAWDHPFDTRMHWVDWYLEIANLTPASLKPPPPLVRAPALTELFVTGAEQAHVDAWLQRQGWAECPLVLMQPGHKKTFKRGRIGTAEHRPPPRRISIALGFEHGQHPAADGQAGRETGYRGQVGERPAGDRGVIRRRGTAEPGRREQRERGRRAEGEHGHPPAHQ
jgi:hypothetical protein